MLQRGGILDISYNKVYVYYADKGTANATLVMLLLVSIGKGQVQLFHPF